MLTSRVCTIVAVCFYPSTAWLLASPLRQHDHRIHLVVCRMQLSPSSPRASIVRGNFLLFCSYTPVLDDRVFCRDTETCKMIT